MDTKKLEKLEKVTSLLMDLERLNLSIKQMKEIGMEAVDSGRDFEFSFSYRSKNKLKNNFSDSSSGSVDAEVGEDSQSPSIEISRDSNGVISGTIRMENPKKDGLSSEDFTPSEMPDFLKKLLGLVSENPEIQTDMGYRNKIDMATNLSGFLAHIKIIESGMETERNKVLNKLEEMGVEL